MGYADKSITSVHSGLLSVLLLLSICWCSANVTPIILSRILHNATSTTQVWPMFLEHLVGSLRDGEFSTMILLYADHGLPECCWAGPRLPAMILNASLSVGRPPPPLGSLSLFVVWGTEGCRTVMKLTQAADVAVVILSDAPPGPELVTEWLQACWKLALVNVILAHRVSRASNDIAVFTFNAFAPGNCRKAIPHALRIWTGSSEPVREYVDSGLRRGFVSDMRGCPIRVVTLPLIPWVFFKWNKEHSKFWAEGKLASLLTTIAEALNSTLEFAFASEGEQNSSSSSSRSSSRAFDGDLVSDAADICMMPIYQRNISTFVESLISNHLSSCPTWCLPTNYNTGLSPWRLILAGSSGTLWLCIVAALLLATATLGTLSRVSSGAPLPWARAAFLSLGAVVGATGHFKPSAAAVRIFFWAWCFYGLTLSSQYTAVQHSMTASHRGVTLFRSLEEVAESNLPLFILDVSKDAYLSSTLDSRPEHILARRAKPLNGSNLFNHITRMATNRKFGVLAEIDSCIYYARTLGKGTEPPPIHALHGFCAQFGQGNIAVLQMAKRSPLLPGVRRLLGNLDGSGLSARYFQTWLRRETIATPPSAVALSMHELLPFFLFLVCGLSISSLTFLIELPSGFSDDAPKVSFSSELLTAQYQV